jgi:hypothetical protein
MVFDILKRLSNGSWEIVESAQGKANAERRAEALDNALSPEEKTAGLGYSWQPASNAPAARRRLKGRSRG